MEVTKNFHRKSGGVELIIIIVMRVKGLIVVITMKEVNKIFIARAMEVELIIIIIIVMMAEGLIVVRTTMTIDGQCRAHPSMLSLIWEVHGRKDSEEDKKLKIGVGIHFGGKDS